VTVEGAISFCSCSRVLYFEELVDGIEPSDESTASGSAAACSVGIVSLFVGLATMVVMAVRDPSLCVISFSNPNHSILYEFLPNQN
jgi:hypothetical protein